MNNSCANMCAMKRGFTLIEMIVAIAVLSILLALGVPSYTALLDRNRVKGASLALYDDLQFARSAAIRNSTDVYMTFTTSGGGSTWCWGMNQGAACNCSTGSCLVDGVSKVVSSSEFTGVKLSASTFVTGTSLAFEPRRGLARNLAGTDYSGDLTFTSAGAKSITTQLSIVGRVSQCSTDIVGLQASCD